MDELPIDGTIGYEWLWNTPTLIDYAARQLTFYDPASFVYRGSAAAMPLTFHNMIPQIEAVLDGLPGKFNIDTGSDYSLTMSKAFVDATRWSTNTAPATRCRSAAPSAA